MATTISIDVIFNAINKTGNAMGQVNRGLNGMMNNLWKVNQAADLMGRMSQSIGQMSAPYAGYNQGLADLSSITGIAGADLKSLGKTARKVGKDSGLGAVGALEAYKLLASQIDVSKIGMKGLNELQAKTITLAQASGMDMANSALSLSGTINQFGLAADQADRVMNVLAAGSKYGAAEIPELSQSFKVVGTAAAAAGLNVEQTGGALEALSKANLKGSESGTALRNILNSMQTKLGFDFKVTKLSDALKTLSGKQGDAAYMSKIFGQENIAAAQFLVKNADLVDEMTSRMTGTNVATEQANIRNKTFNHRMQVMKARLNDLSIGFFKSNSGLLQWVQMGGQTAMMMTTMTPIVGFLEKGFTGTIIGITKTVKAARLMNGALAAGKLGTYTQLISRYGIAGRIAAGGLKIASGAQAAWNAVAGFTTGTMGPLIAKTWAWTAALWANPITWIVAGVMALVAAVLLAWKHFDWFRGGIVAAWEVVKQFGKILFDSIVNPIQKIIAGIKKVVQAFQLLKKKDFSGAWKLTKEGFGDIGKGMIQSTPVGMVKNVIDRRGEMASAARSGYDKGKSIDTSKFLYNSKKQDKPLSVKDMQNPVSGVVPVDGKLNMDMPEPASMQIPGMMNMDSPVMKLVKVPGTMDTLSPKANSVRVPGAMDTLSPKVNPIQVPGAMDMPAPPMKVVKVPGTMDAIKPKVNAVQIPGMMSVPSPSIKGMKATGTIDTPTPAIKPVKVKGILDIVMPKIKAVTIPAKLGVSKFSMSALLLPFIGNQDKDEKRKLSNVSQSSIVATENNLSQVTKNITQNIVKNEARTENLRNLQNNKIEVTYSPQVNISAELTEQSRDNLMEMLRKDKDELMRLINEEQRKNRRLNYAG